MTIDDRLDEGFELLKACSREQAQCDLNLEERMMREFSKVEPRWMPTLGKIAAVFVLCIVVAGASVAATGGFSRILKNFTGTVEFADGEIMTVEDGKLLDAEGNVIGDVEIEIPEDGSVEDGETLSDLNLQLKPE